MTKENKYHKTGCPAWAENIQRPLEKCTCQEGKGFNVCKKEVSRLAVNELIPFEQTAPFSRLAHILDLKCEEFIKKQIDFFIGHCKLKPPQRKCSTCIVLEDLKIKLFYE